jgi:hypothetical protein
MVQQPALFDLREETRPLRKVVDWKNVSRWKSIPLLECGHAGDPYIGRGDNMPKRKRCTPCGAYGNDEDGLKYKVPS